MNDNLREYFEVNYNIPALLGELGIKQAIMVTSENIEDEDIKKQLPDEDVEDGSYIMYANKLILIRQNPRISIGNCKYQIESIYKNENEVWEVTLIKISDNSWHSIPACMLTDKWHNIYAHTDNFYELLLNKINKPFNPNKA